MGFVLDTLMSLFIFFCYEEKKSVSYTGKVLSCSSHLSHATAISPNRTEMSKVDKV